MSGIKYNEIPCRIIGVITPMYIAYEKVRMVYCVNVGLIGIPADEMEVVPSCYGINHQLYSDSPGFNHCCGGKRPQ